ncbi:MAG: LPS assembly protein LptD [Woeseiaceae bacterium]
MTSRYLITACALFAVPYAHGQEPLACDTSLRAPAVGEMQSSDELADERTIEFEAGRVEAQLGDSPTARLSDGVLVRSGSKLAGADTARYEPASQALVLEGNVRYADDGTEVASDVAEFSYGSGRVRFQGAQFSLGTNNARGNADNVVISDAGGLELDNVSYTTCPPGSNDWLLQAKSIDLDTRSGIGTAKGIKLRFQGVPVLYAPRLSFPLSDARKSGLLAPEIGSTSRSGNEIVLPIYWNIAPNYDATFTPRLLTDRGLQLQTEFRYLTAKNDGVAQAEYLPDDSLVDDARYQLRYVHKTEFDSGWRNQIHLREVSDSQYFEDLGGSLSSSSITHLDRNVRFDYRTDTLLLFAQAQDFQTIDDALLPQQQPYQRLPQLLVSGRWPTKLLHLNVGLDGEVVNFDRDAGVTGWRANIAPQLELPFGGPGWFIKPAAAYDYTSYELSNTLPGEDTNPSRGLPIASLDTGLILERNLKSGRQQTLEPRLLYVYIPFEDQDALPVFDTITPDLNFVQLFRKNRYLGVDRIGDTQQVSIGVTSRILDADTGKELVRATIGQTRYFRDRMVTLPGNTTATIESSDYLAEMRFLLYDNVNFDLGHQWSTGGEATQSEARLQYRPANKKIVNLAYRYRRDSLEQGDMSWSWPVSRQWNFVGRYNYSFRDDKVLEQFFGLEYESCCWGLRLVSRRYISTRDGTSDSSFGLQLVLKGMSSVGTAADKLLENGILGYSADLR